MTPSRNDIENIKIETGKRTYFLNAVATTSGKKYIKISERISKEDGTHYYDKVIIYEEDLEEMCLAFSRMLKHFKVNKRLRSYKGKPAPLDFKNNDKPWDAKDDLKLEKLYCKQKTIDELIVILERSNSDIEARIRKLGLEDKYDFNIN